VKWQHTQALQNLLRKVSPAGSSGIRCNSISRISLSPGRSSGPGMNRVICGPLSGQYHPRLNPFTQATPCRSFSEIIRHRISVPTKLRDLAHGVAAAHASTHVGQATHVDRGRTDRQYHTLLHPPRVDRNVSAGCPPAVAASAGTLNLPLPLPPNASLLMCAYWGVCNKCER
jgi:hypothetical protein